MIPLCVLEDLPKEEIPIEEEFDMPNGVETAPEWKFDGEPVWEALSCEVCGVALKDDEVDLCEACEEKYYE